jgi:2-polyprenyl-3-methyl-5-hydroxy-6-metoxy-1,4-benzoquinol methylase
MDYDPVKDRFGTLVAGSRWRTRQFFRLLHLFFLRAWHVRRALRQALGPADSEARVLDAGTGFGQFAWWIVKRWKRMRIHAVDIKPDYIERAEHFLKQEGLADRVTFAIDDLTALEAEGPFDLILSVDVMEHILEDVQVFTHFHRVLRPGGFVIINTPSDQGGSDAHGEEGESFIGEHVRDGYGREEMQTKLAQAGLEADVIDYTYGPFGSLAWRLTIKWPMIWLNTSFLAVFLLPLWYGLVLLPSLVLNALDVSSKNRTGTGLIVVAHRP